MPEEGFLGAFARIASTFVGGAPDAHRHVWNAIAPWVTELVKSANVRWLPYLVHGIPCEIGHHDEHGRAQRCPGSAIAACSICRTPCCPHHSFVSSEGLAACFPCVSTAQQHAHANAPHAPKVNWPPGTRGGQRPPAQPPPPPPPTERVQPLDERIRAARKILRVKSTATWPEIEASYKTLLAQHHPDKHPPGERDAATERFKRVRAAYDLLKQTPGAHP